MPAALRAARLHIIDNSLLAYKVNLKLLNDDQPITNLAFLEASLEECDDVTNLIETTSV